MAYIEKNRALRQTQLIGRFKSTGALQHGEFTLASGAKSTYYIDVKRVALDGTGLHLIAESILDRLGRELVTLPIDAIGGPVLGAVPIIGAVLGQCAYRGYNLTGLLVRNEAKDYGTGKQIEGDPAASGRHAVIIEDVVTSGGSLLRAADVLKNAGWEIVKVISVVDRLAGGREKIEAEGYEYESLLTVEDLGVPTVPAVV